MAARLATKRGLRKTERLRTGEEVERAGSLGEDVLRATLGRDEGRVGAAEVVREAKLELLRAVDLGNLLGRKLDLE